MVLKVDKCQFIDDYQKEDLTIILKKIQNINFNMINNIIKKYNIDADEIKEDDLFNKKIFKKSKGNLKLLNIGKLDKTINLEISYASKKQLKYLEKLGGKIKLIKKK